jgi:FkbM family methyltransferase
MFRLIKKINSKIKNKAKSFFRTAKNTSLNPRSVNEVSWISDLFSACNDGFMIDVGAHFGESFSAFANRGWKVFAFEPDPLIRKQDAIKRNLNSQSKLFTCALSNTESDDAIFYNSDVSTGISGIIPFHASHSNCGTVQVRKLLRFINEFNIQEIDFLKIDTEGHEYKVILGLKKHISKVSLILFEHHYDNMIIKDYNFSKINNYLIKNNFRKIFKIKMPFRKTFEYIYENIKK